MSEALRAASLGETAYASCEEVAPDAAILTRIADTPGAVVHISFSFLQDASGCAPCVSTTGRPT